MLLTKELRKEIFRMLLGMFVLCAVMIAVFFIAGYGGTPVILGALLGMFVAVLNYYLLALTISLTCRHDISKAKSYMGLSYPLRIIIMAAAIIFAIKNPAFNYIATAIPLLFPRILVTLFGTVFNKKTKRNAGEPAAETSHVVEAEFSEVEADSKEV